MKYLENLGFNFTSKRFFLISSLSLLISIFCLLCAFADVFDFSSFWITLLATLGVSVLIYLLLFTLIFVKMQMCLQNNFNFPCVKFLAVNQLTLSITLLIFGLFCCLFLSFPIFFSIAGVVFLLSLGFFYVGSLYEAFKEFFVTKQIWFLRILKLFWFGSISVIVFLWILA